MTRTKGDRGFDFRELASFNLALLGNMAARLMDEHDALWARLLRAIYFHTTYFFQATKGGDPRGAG